MPMKKAFRVTCDLFPETSIVAAESAAKAKAQVAQDLDEWWGIPFFEGIRSLRCLREPFYDEWAKSSKYPRVIDERFLRRRMSC